MKTTILFAIITLVVFIRAVGAFANMGHQFIGGSFGEDVGAVAGIILSVLSIYVAVKVRKFVRKHI